MTAMIGTTADRSSRRDERRDDRRLDDRLDERRDYNRREEEEPRYNNRYEERRGDSRRDDRMYDERDLSKAYDEGFEDGQRNQVVSERQEHRENYKHFTFGVYGGANSTRFEGETVNGQGLTGRLGYQLRFSGAGRWSGLWPDWCRISERPARSFLKQVTVRLQTALVTLLATLISATCIFRLTSV